MNLPSPSELASRLQGVLALPKGVATVWVWYDGHSLSLRVRVDPSYRASLMAVPAQFEGLPVVVETREPFEAADRTRQCFH
ncbi:hypothetical protein IWX58_004389 [Rubrivivax gelatinosus]|uniref:hypothetical protein n=1 Tax=Rubrivivax gelatinosus TaxID=28068 RepID=UPI0005C1CB69|nr:hypothetical protein [Rubrivivax gelatinosus]MBG6082702.1 hypothetical protein [Rubrivivax gelatinosus]